MDTLTEHFSLNKTLFDEHIPLIAKRTSQLTNVAAIKKQVAELCNNASKESTLHVFMHEFSAHIHTLKQQVLRVTTVAKSASVDAIQETMVSHLCVILFTLAKIHWQNTTPAFLGFKNVCFRAIHSTVAEHVALWNRLFKKHYDLVVRPSSLSEYWKGVVCAIKMFAQKMHQDMKESILDVFDLDDHLDADENGMRIAVARETLEKLQTSYHFRNTLFICYFLHDVLKNVVADSDWIVGSFNRTVDTIGASELTKFLHGNKHVFINYEQKNNHSSVLLTHDRQERHCKYRHNLDIPFTFFHVPFLLTIDQRLKTLENCHANKAYMAAKAYVHKTSDFCDFFKDPTLPSAMQANETDERCSFVPPQEQTRIVRVLSEREILDADIVSTVVTSDETSTSSPSYSYARPYYSVASAAAAATSSPADYSSLQAAEEMYDGQTTPRGSGGRSAGINNQTPVAITRTRKRCRGGQSSDAEDEMSIMGIQGGTMQDNSEQVKRLKNDFATCLSFQDESAMSNELHLENDEPDDATEEEVVFGERIHQQLGSSEDADENACIVVATSASVARLPDDKPSIMIDNDCLQSSTETTSSEDDTLSRVCSFVDDVEDDSEYDEEHDTGDLPEDQLDEGDIDVGNVQKNVHLKRGNITGCFINSVLCSDRSENLLPVVVSFENEPEANDRGGVSSEGFRLFFKELFANKCDDHPLFNYNTDTSMYWPRRYNASDTNAATIIATFWEAVGMVIALAFHNNNWQALLAGFSPLMMVKLLKEEPITTADFQALEPSVFRSMSLMKACTCRLCKLEDESDIRRNHHTNEQSTQATESCEDAEACLFYGIQFLRNEQVTSLDMHRFHEQRKQYNEGAESDWTHFLRTVDIKRKQFDISTLVQSPSSSVLSKKTGEDGGTSTDSHACVNVSRENTDTYWVSTCLHQTGFPWFVDARDGVTKTNPFTNSAWLFMLKGIRSINDRREWSLFGADELNKHFNKGEMLKALKVSDLQTAVEYRGFSRAPNSNVCKSGYAPTSEYQLCSIVKKHLQYHAEEVHTYYHEYFDWFWNTVEEFSKSQLESLLMFMASDLDILRKLVAKEVTIVIINNEGDNFTLPSASTCFNTLKLPVYSTKVALQKHLRLILDYSEGFGVE